MDIDLLVLLQNISIQDLFREIEQHFDSLIAHPKPMQFHLVKIWRAVGYKNNRELILDFLLAELPFHHHILKRAVGFDFLGFPLKVVTLEDLILLKKCAKRPQDVADITTIYASYNDEIDHDYIAFWTKELNITE
jgi:hypothetical protein